MCFLGEHQHQNLNLKPSNPQTLKTRRMCFSCEHQHQNLNPKPSNSKYTEDVLLL